MAETGPGSGGAGPGLCGAGASPRWARIARSPTRRTGKICWWSGRIRNGRSDSLIVTATEVARFDAREKLTAYAQEE